MWDTDDVNGNRACGGADCDRKNGCTGALAEDFPPAVTADLPPAAAATEGPAFFLRAAADTLTVETSLLPADAVLALAVADVRRDRRVPS